MGEYAREDIKRRFGVDIGDDTLPRKPKPARHFGCQCGRMFLTSQALADHKRDKHGEVK